MSTYLLKRVGGTYYFRRSIPLAQRQRFGGKTRMGAILRDERPKRSKEAYTRVFDRV